MKEHFFKIRLIQKRNLNSIQIIRSTQFSFGNNLLNNSMLTSNLSCHNKLIQIKWWFYFYVFNVKVTTCTNKMKKNKVITVYHRSKFISKFHSIFFHLILSKKLHHIVDWGSSVHSTFIFDFRYWKSTDIKKMNSFQFFPIWIFHVQWFIECNWVAIHSS